MRPVIHVSTTPDGGVTHVHLQVHDLDDRADNLPIWEYRTSLGREPEHRPTHCHTYAYSVLRQLLGRLEYRLDQLVPDDPPRPLPEPGSSFRS